MKKKIAVFLALVLFFELCRVIFMFCYWDIYEAYPLLDWLTVLSHGFAHDFTVAGLIMLLPFALEIVRILRPGAWHDISMRIYFSIIVLPVLLFLGVDFVLYGFWGFRLDTTPLIYLMDNPVEALMQSPPAALIASPIGLIAFLWLIQKPLRKLFPESCSNKVKATDRSPRLTIERATGHRLSRILTAAAMIFFIILLERSVTLGTAYYTTDMRLNQAAINPAYSVYYAMKRPADFSVQYRFMDDETCRNALIGLETAPARFAQPDSVLQPRISLLNTDRPNILLVLLESFSGSACHAIAPEADPAIMPCINALYGSSVSFSRFYANSFRTDRGMAAVMAAYPSQPCYTIMNNPDKVGSLQYISGRLKEYGWRGQFIYGGDAAFTNLKGFLHAGGIDDIVEYTDFPEEQSTSQWGVPDEVLFDYLYNSICSESEARRQDSTLTAFFKATLTLSSHEPFDAPIHKFEDPYINSVAYTDSCLGLFIDRLSHSPAWDNLLIIAVADHGYANYPPKVQNHEMKRQLIPMFWTGGAVARPLTVPTLASQVDIAATLLHQLGLPYDDFNFSHDIFDPKSPHFVEYTWPDGFGFLTDSIRYIQDNEYDGHGLDGTEDPNGTAQRWGKAYLQALFDDIAKR